MDLVELHLQAGDAGTFALASFEIQQELAAVGLQGAQLIQFRRIAHGHDAAVADLHRRFGSDGAYEQRKTVDRLGDIGGNESQSW